MKRFFLPMLLVLLSACAPRSFTFVHMSDPQIGFLDNSPHYIHSDTLFRKAVDEVNRLRPLCAVLTGDLVNEPRNREQDSVYRVNTARLQMPVYEVPGNHDIMNFTQEKREWYLGLRGYDRFSFKMKGYRFIGIDSNCIKDGSEEAENEQFEWLVSELEKASGKALVFLHCPIVREQIDEPEDYFNLPVDKRKKYLDLFLKYGVRAVFSGHTHMEYEGEYKGIRLFTAGPVGNALGRGFPGFNMVTVDKNGITARFVPTPGVDASTAMHR